ncbi:MAG: hypothetical protein SH847_18435 [Roseiflexaceae bacterium]|nr:hypothetical protein [Roseiflexaceae bacterium]
MAPINHNPVPPARPWGCVLLLLAALLLLRGMALTQPERATREWPQPDNFRSLQFASDGALVLQDYTTLTWYDATTVDLSASTPDATLYADWELTDMAISPDGQWVAVGTKQGTLTLWTGAPHWRPLETLQLGSDGSIAPISFSADGRSVCWVASSHTADGTKTISIRVWDRVTRQDRFTLTQTAQGSAAAFDYGSASLSSDGQVIVLIGETFELRQVDTNQLIYRIARDPRPFDSFGNLVISPDQQWLATDGGAIHTINPEQWVASGGQGQVTIRRFSDGAVVQVLHGPPNGDHLVAFSPDSRYLAVAANTTSGGFFGPAFRGGWEPVTLYRVADWQVVQTFQGHIEGAFGLAYSPDGNYLATYGTRVGDLTIRLWRVSPHHPFEPLFWFGSGLTLLITAFGRWIWLRRTHRV